MRRLLPIITLIPLLILMLMPGLSAAEPAIEELRVTIDQITTVLEDESLKEKTKIRRDKLWNIVNKRFDDTYMTKRVLTEKLWKKLTVEQQAEIVPLFTGLIKRSFFSKVEAYSGQKIFLTKEKNLTGNRVEISGYIMNRTEEIPMGFRMIKGANGWSIYDILIDHLSQVGHFKRKFKRIIKKDGYDGLVAFMKAKQASYDAIEKD